MFIDNVLKKKCVKGGVPLNLPLIYFFFRAKIRKKEKLVSSVPKNKKYPIVRKNRLIYEVGFYFYEISDRSLEKIML